MLAACGKTAEEGVEETRILPEEVLFTSDELYPEGVDFSPEQDMFFVTSLRQGTIGTVDWDGNYTTFIDDDELKSNIGLRIDHENGLLLVCSSDPGVSVKTDPETQRKYAKLGIYDLATGERKHLVDLGGLNDPPSFANDIAIAAPGEYYVTNSFSPYIYKVTSDGEAEVFFHDAQYSAEGFGFNGIAAHSDGYLLVNHSTTGKLYKLPMDAPDALEEVRMEETFPGADGLVVMDNNNLVLIQNSTNEAHWLVTPDGWNTASVLETDKSVFTFPTTGTAVGDEVFILNAKLNEVFDPETENTSNFLIQRLSFSIGEEPAGTAAK